MPYLMMNQVRIHNFIETEDPFTEEELFNKLCRMYNKTSIKDISTLWCYSHNTTINVLKKTIDDADNEDRDNEDEWEIYNFVRHSIMDLNLLLIKNYTPDIYNSYEYNFDYDEYNEFFDDDSIFFKKAFEPT